MRTEAYSNVSPHDVRSSEMTTQQLRDRIDQLREIVNVFGTDTPKGKNASAELAKHEVVLKEREVMETLKVVQSEMLTQRRQEPRLTVPEQTKLEGTERINVFLTDLVSEMSKKGFGRAVDSVLELLRQQEEVHRFLEDKTGIERFTQRVRDPRAKRYVDDALRRFYADVNQKTYLKEAA